MQALKSIFFFRTALVYSTINVICNYFQYNSVLLNTQRLNTHLIYLHKTSGIHTSSFLCAVFIWSVSLQTAWVFKNGILCSKRKNKALFGLRLVNC